MEQAGRDMGKAFAKGLSSMMSADLELKSDNTYSMTILFISVEGNYLVSGDTVTLTPAKIMGKTIAQIQAESKDPQKNNMIQPMVLKAASDGKSLKLQDSKAEPGALVFTRETETK